MSIKPNYLSRPDFAHQVLQRYEMACEPVRPDYQEGWLQEFFADLSGEVPDWTYYTLDAGDFWTGLTLIDDNDFNFLVIETAYLDRRYKSWCESASA